MSVNGSPSEGVWEVVREEVEYDEPACYPGSSPYSSPYVRTTTVQSPHVQPVVNTTVTRYVSPVCSSHTDGVPSNMCNNSVITCSPTRRHHSSVVHGSPGRVVSRRVVRYASPVRSRVTTTTTYRCSPASPWPESDACVNAAAADLLPSYEAPRGGLYTPKKGNVARPGVDWERLAAESRGDTGRSGSSYPISCKKATMLEAEESAPEPAPGLPQTARAKSKASPSPGRMTRQPLRVYYEESDEEGVECIEMEPDPSKPAGQCLRSSGSLAFSDSEDDYAGRPPQKKRMSAKKLPTPLTTTHTQTEDTTQVESLPDQLILSLNGGCRYSRSMMYHVSTAKVEDCGLLLGGHEYMTLGVLSSSAASPSRPYLSPCYRERSRELKEKEAELEQFLQMSAKRRGRLIDSIRKRRRNSDGEEEENADGIQLPKVEAGGRWGGSSGNQQAMFSRKLNGQAMGTVAAKRSLGGSAFFSKNVEEGDLPVSQFLPRQKSSRLRRKPCELTNQTPSLPTGASYLRAGKPLREDLAGMEKMVSLLSVALLRMPALYRVRRLFGEGAPHAPIDDEQWKELAMKLRQQAESHTISVDRS
ncbi:hypothetical protein FOZ63_034070 [Perkinsus olseni]|uniref:Uncharacterized protein n=1 Tax=Perkinsus olseni TaxID=32597 RepID=A0A7J6PTH1_PEROL|nr:hypothetical protein FOZ63_034070 [Perkinsus olseni]